MRVESFLADYAHRLDDGKIDDWTGFFTEDATYQITTRENYEAGYPIGIMLCKGKGMMEDRVLALKTANVFEPHTYCHIVGRPDLREESPGTLSARSNFIVYRTMEDGEAELFATGKYLDRIVLEAGEPRFKERRVILDSRRIDVLLVYPL
jgi:anthranilate 1,2-dioxygenase small subunit